MPVAFLSVAHLLLAVLFLQAGSGLLHVLVPIRAQMEGFSTETLGLLGAAYYAGFVLGCVRVPALMRRVGHIRAFSGLAALAAAAFLVHQLLVTEWVWLGLRAMIGFSFAGLYMAVESWLNDRATGETRGQVLAAYMVTSWIAIIGGNLIFAWSDPGSFLPFTLASIGICLAVLPVAFTTGTAPAPAPPMRLRVGEIYAVSPVGVVGCFCVGAVNGAFWALAPIYADGLGLTTTQIGFFMSVAVLGGALTQWPLGRWSDRTDRRRVIVAACLGAALAAAVLALRGSEVATGILVLALLFGTTALPLYAVCLAHANDKAPADSFVAVSSGLLTMFGIGAVLGPYLAALLMAAIGPGGVFAFTGGIHLALAGFTILRMRRQEPVSDTAKTAFVAVPRTTQAVLPLDPRAEPEPAPEPRPESGPIPHGVKDAGG